VRWCASFFRVTAFLTISEGVNWFGMVYRGMNTVRVLPKILCVCSGNTDRSPMLKAILQLELARAGDYNIAVHSAGTSLSSCARHPASFHVQKLFPGMLHSHTSKWIGELSLNQYGVILCMTNAQRKNVFALQPDLETTVLSFPGDLPDPKGLDERVYKVEKALLLQWGQSVLFAFKDSLHSCVRK
jgi:protein-tyrosine-phosphatase